MSRLETDYLVVGAGALGMAFVDSLIEHCDADVVIVERRHRPGGHWLDAYPFVQLHQPSRYYGVDSTPLGQDRLEPEGTDTDFSERASGAEICGYFDELMRHRFLTSGRVRFFPMCDYLGDRRFRSRVTDRVTDVTVRDRVGRRDVHGVTRAGHRSAAVRRGRRGALRPGRRADDGRAPGRRVRDRRRGQDRAGRHRLAARPRDAIRDDITWIRPRDTWVLNRAFFQPGRARTFEGVVLQLEAMVASQSVEEVYERLEADGVVVRTDRSVVPTMMKGATVSVRELEQLRRVEHVVRLGHVERIEPDEIILEQGSVPTSPDHLHVHCAASGLSDNPPRAIFTDDTITLQLVTRVSAHVVGRVAGVPRSDGADHRGEEPAVPADRHAPHAVRLPPGGDGRHPHGDRVARGTRSPGMARPLASQPHERSG